MLTHTSPVGDIVCFCWHLSGVLALVQKRNVFCISAFVTSVGCYGECEVHKATVSPGNMLRPPPWDESLSCPGVSGLPLRVSCLHASWDRPQLMSHHFLLPVSILILFPVHSNLPPWPYLMKCLCHCLFPWLFATLTVPCNGVAQGIHSILSILICFAVSVAYTHRTVK